MNDYLANLRRRRQLVTNLVHERHQIHATTLSKQRVAITYDQQQKELLANKYNTYKAITQQRSAAVFQKNQLKRLRGIKQKFLHHMAVQERTIFDRWKHETAVQAKARQEQAEERRIEERLTAIEHELQARQHQEMVQLVQDAHAPRRKGTVYQRSSGVTAQQRMFAASRHYLEREKAGGGGSAGGGAPPHLGKLRGPRTKLLNRIKRGYDVEENMKQRKHDIRHLLIRPMPEILDPPQADRPEYPTTALIGLRQSEDPLYKCMLLYLNIPLEERKGQVILREDNTKRRQALSDEMLFRQRQDGLGLGVQRSLHQDKRNQQQKQHEYMLHVFHRHNLSLPVTVAKMIATLRPLTLDPKNNCLYLCRRPDVPAALSLSTDTDVFVLHRQNTNPLRNKTKHLRRPSLAAEVAVRTPYTSVDDVLRNKLLLVPEMARANVLWWSYQESQQRRHQQEQHDQSQTQLRLSRQLKRQGMREWHVLEQKMIREGIPFEEIEKIRKFDEQEIEFLNATLGPDQEAERLYQLKLATTLKLAAVRQKRSKVLLTKMIEDKKGVKRTTNTSHRKKETGHYVAAKAEAGVAQSKPAKEMMGGTKAKSPTELKAEAEEKRKRVKENMAQQKHDNYFAAFVKDEMENVAEQETVEELIADVLATVLLKFWWPTVAADVRRYCAQFNLLEGAPEHATGSSHDAHHQFYLAATRNDLAEMKRLYTHEGAGVFGRGQEMGETAVHHAVKHANMKMLTWLHYIYGGVKLHTIEATRQTPAMLATTTGQLPMVQWMHQHQFPLTGVDVCGMTILHHAVLSGSLGMVQYLYLTLQAKHPLVVDGHDNNGNTPLMLAQGDPRRKEIAEWLRKNLNRWEGNIQRLRELDPIALQGDDYNPMLEYQRQRASNLIQRYVRRMLALKFVKKFKQDEKARRQRNVDLKFMPPSMKKRNGMQGNGGGGGGGGSGSVELPAVKEKKKKKKKKQKKKKKKKKKQK